MRLLVLPVLVTLALVAPALAISPAEVTITPLWERPALHVPDAVLAMDVTGDGRDDVVAGGTNGVMVLDPARDSADRLVWVREGGNTPALAAFDVDANGVRDVIAGDNDGRVRALDGATGRVLWSFRAPGFVNAVAAGVVDDAPVIAVAGEGTRVHVLDAANGTLRWSAVVGNIASCVVIADVTGDGVSDVVAGSVGFRFYAFHGATGALAWSVPAEEGVRACAVADMNGDGTLDAIAGTQGPLVMAVDGPTGRSIWERTLPHSAHEIAVGDVTRDGVPDVAVTVRDDSVHLLDGRDGASAWSVTFDDQPEPVIVADVTGDARLDVVTGDWAHAVTVLDENGLRQWVGRARAEVRALAAPASGGVLAIAGAHAAHTGGVQPGLLEPELPHYDFRAYAFHADGRVAADLPLGGYGHSIGFADVTGDGVADVFEGNSDHRVYARDGRSGTLLWEFFTGGLSSAVAVLDVDGDDAPELAVASDVGAVFLLDAVTGDARWRVDAPPGTWIKTLGVGDFDEDGLPDVVAGGRDGVVRAMHGLTGVVLWSHAAPAGVTALDVGDVNVDGVPDVIVGLEASPSPELIALDGRVVVPSVSHRVDTPALPRLPFLGHPVPDRVDVTFNTRTLWSLALGSRVSDVAMGMLEDAHVVVVGVENGRVLGLDAAFGVPRWTATVPGVVRDVTITGFTSAPAVVVSDESGAVTAFTADGVHAWTRAPPSAELDESAWTVRVANVTGAPVLVVAQWTGLVQVVAPDGALLAEHAVPRGVYFARPFDVDADGAPEVLASTMTGPLVALTLQGTP